MTALTLQRNAVQITLKFGFPCADYAAELKPALEAPSGCRSSTARASSSRSRRKSRRTRCSARSSPWTGSRTSIAVASGKGGVGKSTIAANLALAWAAQGARVGLLDADIYGPSQPLMMGLAGRKPESPDGKHIDPLRAHGIEVMSIGFMIDAEQPMAWRGPMVTQALTQLLGDTHWGELDYLVVDMPPGTGDIQLTLAQRVPVSGAVIVTTPQDIALLDARKGLKMFEKVEVRVLGIVENMSVHICSNCGHAEHIFGSGGGARMAEQYGVQLLGELPLDIRIREEADGGAPTVVAEPEQRARAGLFQHGAARGGAARDIEQGLQLGVPQDHGRSDVSIKSDRWIRRMAAEHGMIEPFSPEQVRVARRPQDRLLRHLELWVRRALRRRIQDLHQHQFHHRRPQELR